MQERTFSAAGTLWREHTVVIVDTVDFVVHVHGERYPVEAFVANAAPETARMVGFAHRLQNHFHDKMPADCTLFRRLLKAGVLEREMEGVRSVPDIGNEIVPNYHVVFFAVDPSMYVVEGLSPESASARTADETVCVIQVTHGLTGRSRSGYLLLAGVTDAWN